MSIDLGVASSSFAGVFGMEEHQEELRRSLRSILERHSPIVRVREVMQHLIDTDDVTWAKLTEFGLVGAFIPAELGGAGMSFSDAVIGLEETGAALACTPHLATMTAAAALLACGGAGNMCAAALLRKVAAGTTATIAVAENGDWRGSPSTIAHADGDGFVLHGGKELVLDGATADVLLVSAVVGDEVAFFAVEGGATGLTRVPLPMVDQTRKLADLRLDRVRAERISGSTAEHVGTSLDLAIMLLAAEQMGAAKRVLDLSVEHAKSRFQYDRAIGSFQAVKHMCAEMLIEIEYAQGAVQYAAGAVTTAPDQLSTLAAVLKSTVAEAFVFAAGTTIQVHGGLGFAWEHDAHLYYKRAIGDRVLYGSVGAYQDRLGDLLGW